MPTAVRFVARVTELSRERAEILERVAHGELDVEEAERLADENEAEARSLEAPPGWRLLADGGWAYSARWL